MSDDLEREYQREELLYRAVAVKAGEEQGQVVGRLVCAVCTVERRRPIFHRVRRSSWGRVAELHSLREMSGREIDGANERKIRLASRLTLFTYELLEVPYPATAPPMKLTCARHGERLIDSADVVRRLDLERMPTIHV